MKLQSGFSLLEVLVALAVVGIAMGAAMSAMSRGVDNLTVLERRTLSSWVAENQISNLRIELMRNLQMPTELNGEEEMAGRIWYWQANIEATEDEAVNRMLMRVSLREDMRAIESVVTTYFPVLSQ